MAMAIDVRTYVSDHGSDRVRMGDLREEEQQQQWRWWCREKDGSVGGLEGVGGGGYVRNDAKVREGVWVGGWVGGWGGSYH